YLECGQSELRGGGRVNMVVAASAAVLESSALFINASEGDELPLKPSSLPCLTDFSAGDCNFLKQFLPKSIGDMDTLYSLNLVGSNIEELPEDFGKLENLVELRMSNCKMLKRLPESFGDLKSLHHLYMQETLVSELPESFRNLSDLMILKMPKKPLYRIAESDAAGTSEEPRFVEVPNSFSNLLLLEELDARSWRISQVSSPSSHVNWSSQTWQTASHWSVFRPFRAEDNILRLMKVLSCGRKRKVILEAPLYNKDCVLGNILAAHFLSSSDPSRANSYVETAASNLEQCTPYEKAVYEALTYLISEDRDDDLAFELHTKLLNRFPKDLASLKRAQLLCFYMGQPDPFLGLVQQVLPANQEESYIHGILAFPLLELGRMEEAVAASKKGYEINKEEAWAHHCVEFLKQFYMTFSICILYSQLCHVLQHECRFKEAVEFVEPLTESWPSCSFFYTHNWWHVALCYLEGGSPMSKVEEIYDHHIWKELEKDDAVPPEVYLNALGLLMVLKTV
ncbi:predicted protein, partial [Arabidopsis lyrata subsp. lyrata]